MGAALAPDLSITDAAIPELIELHREVALSG
jgi:hypothetical protein